MIARVRSASRVVDSIGLSSFVRRLNASYHDALNSFQTFALLFARTERHIGAVACSRTGDPAEVILRMLLCCGRSA